MDRPDTAQPVSNESAPMRACILVVDDQADTRELLRMMLARDHDVVEAADGEAAWDMLRDDARISMMITDLRMPGLDGCDLIGRIRGADEARLRDLPILLVTGADDNAARQRAFLHGATAFVTKPLDMNQLRALVKMYLRPERAAAPSKPEEPPAGKAMVDPLTRLRTAHYLAEHGAQDFMLCVRQLNDLAVICIAIDQFKDLVKVHGRHTTDELLVWFAQLLLSHTRSQDTVARVDEAQFAILALATDARQAEVLCDTIRGAIVEHPFLKGSADIPVTLRIGMATLKRDRTHTLEALLARARERLDGVAEQSAVAEAAPAPDHSVEFVSTSETSVQPEDALDIPPASIEPQTPADIMDAVVPGDSVEAGGAEEVAADLPAEPNAADDIAASPAPEQDAVPPVPVELMSVDTAVMLIAQHHEELLRPYAAYLLRQIEPLLRLQKAQSGSSASSR